MERRTSQEMALTRTPSLFESIQLPLCNQQELFARFRKIVSFQARIGNKPYDET